jgi:adenylosuccinate lyase
VKKGYKSRLTIPMGEWNKAPTWRLFKGFALLSKRTPLVGHPIFPLVEQLSERAEHDLGQYGHWGVTTQDIMDTADVLQIRDASALAPYLWRTARDTPADVTLSPNGGAG